MFKFRQPAAQASVSLGPPNDKDILKIRTPSPMEYVIKLLFLLWTEINWWLHSYLSTYIGFETDGVAGIIPTPLPVAKPI